MQSLAVLSQRVFQLGWNISIKHTQKMPRPKDLREQNLVTLRWEQRFASSRCQRIWLYNKRLILKKNTKKRP